jgi:hypothetical protein
MATPPAAQAPWPSPEYCYDHYLMHHRDLKVRRVEDYDRSARATIRVGRRFTYKDKTSGEPRIGYFDARR